MQKDKTYIIDLPKIADPRGNLTVAEQMKNVPFDVARVYWTYDIYVGTGVWRTLEDFSSGAVCLVLASELFDEDEYIYDKDEFKKLYADD